jgi:hypothetical protein
MKIKIDNITNKISFGLFKRHVCTPIKDKEKLPPTIPTTNNEGKLDFKA